MWSKIPKKHFPANSSYALQLQMMNYRNTMSVERHLQVICNGFFHSIWTVSCRLSFCRRATLKGVLQKIACERATLKGHLQEIESERLFAETQFKRKMVFFLPWWRIYVTAIVNIFSCKKYKTPITCLMQITSP